MKRILLAVSITLALGSGLFAQFGGQRRGGPGGPPLTALKDALGLTDAQVTAITALIQAEQSRMEAIRTEITQKRQVLDALLNAPSPVPVDVGNAAIALHASEAKIKTERDALIAQIKQQLTGEQQQKLETLLASGGGRGFPFLGLGGGRGGSRP